MGFVVNIFSSPSSIVNHYRYCYYRKQKKKNKASTNTTTGKKISTNITNTTQAPGHPFSRDTTALHCVAPSLKLSLHCHTPHLWTSHSTLCNLPMLRCTSKIQYHQVFYHVGLLFMLSLLFYLFMVVLAFNLCLFDIVIFVIFLKAITFVSFVCNLIFLFFFSLPFSCLSRFQYLYGFILSPHFPFVLSFYFHCYPFFFTRSSPLSHSPRFISITLPHFPFAASFHSRTISSSPFSFPPYLIPLISFSSPHIHFISSPHVPLTASFYLRPLLSLSPLDPPPLCLIPSPHTHCLISTALPSSDLRDNPRLGF